MMFSVIAIMTIIDVLCGSDGGYILSDSNGDGVLSHTEGEDAVGDSNGDIWLPLSFLIS